MKITDILKPDMIKINMIATSKIDLLNKMIELAEKSGKIHDTEDARNEIFERERIMSTGIGKGIALPHAKTNSVDDAIGSLAVLEKPIDFDSLDGNPVNLVFMLLGRENNVGTHLRLLSKISRLLSSDSFKARLADCKTSEEAYNLFFDVSE